MFENLGSGLQLAGCQVTDEVKTAAWGIVLMVIAVMARDWGSVFTVGLTVASIVYGPMLGAFLLGMLTTRATERGAMAGIGVSLAAMVGVRMFTPLAWTWYVLVGTAICVAVGMLVSLLERPSRTRLGR
jgi:Na+/proline symporter